jgi:hypothetical protein
VNVTLAPETGVPPLRIVAEIGAVVGGMKLFPATDTVTVSDGALITVTFPVPVPRYEEFEALALMPYVPGGVPEAGVCNIVRDPLCPGLKLMDPTENAGVNPEGWVEEGVNVLAEQADESLLVTFIV